MVLLSCVSLRGKIIGTNPPAKPLTLERIADLPTHRQPAWKQYLEHSIHQHRADQAFLRAELEKHHLHKIIVPPEVGGHRKPPLNRSAAWYRGSQARHIADVILSFQTPSGGWSKNLDLRDHRRRAGMDFAPNNGSRFLRRGDFDKPRNIKWSYVGTFDNGATVTPLRYLAKVVTALGPQQGAGYRAAFLRGLDYIFAAQYPNGGWPQVWPLQGGYHDAITYNDNAMVNVLSLLREVAEGAKGFAFVPAKTRARAKRSLRHGIACVLATQIVVHGRRTVWPQQCDPLTLQPTSARNYEMPAAASSESTSLMLFLMRLPDPSPEVVAAVHAAAAWFQKTRIRDEFFKRVAGRGRELVPAPGSGPLWARDYQVGTDRPIFGDRDKTIHERLAEISKERRNGYAWYTSGPARALEVYGRWSKQHPGLKPAEKP